MSQYVYMLDLTKSQVEKIRFKKSEYESYCKVNEYHEYSNEYDFKVFDTEKQAENWLEKYEKAIKSLSKISPKGSKASILYKRRYLAQTVMSEKLQTYRNSSRVNKMMSKLSPGDQFTLHDQTHFLPVILTLATKVDETTVKYEFKLASN